MSVMTLSVTIRTLVVGGFPVAVLVGEVVGNTGIIFAAHKVD